MPKKIAQKVAKQLKQIPGEIVEDIKKAPSEMAGQALEQLGVSGQSTPRKAPAGQNAIGEKTKLEELKAKDEVFARQEIKKIEAEMARWRQIREEQLHRRREESEPTEEEKRALAAQQEKPLVEPASRPKRGILGGPARLRSAKQKSQAETGPARRVSG